MSPRASSADFHAVLLAGGSGTRFWPLSRNRRPKQLLPLAGGAPLLVEAWRRARRLARRERVWVVAPVSLARSVRRMLPDLLPARLILEPSPRDTAPAIGLACARLAEESPAAIAGVFPTDHVVRDVPAFVRAVRVAIEAASEGRLVCLGVRPDRPATGFGYLRCARMPAGLRPVPVERFVEKPDEARARRFVRSGRYLWNGGMFVWRVERFLEELGRCAPAILRGAREAASGKLGGWSRVPRISVDYAVMEKAKDVSVVPLEAGWDDVGSWEAAARLREAAGGGDGDVIRVDSPGSVVFGGSRLVALVGVERVVVVDTEDALLVASRDRSGDVRRVVEALRERGREDLL